MLSETLNGWMKCIVREKFFDDSVLKMSKCGLVYFFFQAEDGIRDLVRSRGLGDVYKRQDDVRCCGEHMVRCYRAADQQVDLHHIDTSLGAQSLSLIHI